MGPWCAPVGFFVIESPFFPHNTLDAEMRAPHGVTVKNRFFAGWFGKGLTVVNQFNAWQSGTGRMETRILLLGPLTPAGKGHRLFNSTPAAQLY